MPMGSFRFTTRLGFAFLCSVLAVSIAFGQEPAKSVRQASQPDKGAPHTRPRAAKTSSVTRTPVLGDAALERAITQRFAKSAIASNGFTVTVSGGVATLRGSAKVAQHKGVATRLAKSVGAREVRNQIELAPSAREAMQRLTQRKVSKAKTRNPPEIKRPAPGGQGSPGLSPADSTVPRTQQGDDLAKELSKPENSVTNSPANASNNFKPRSVKRFLIVSPRSRKLFGVSAPLQERHRRY